MELPETHDPEKRKLIEASDRYKRELEQEVSAVTEKTERVLTNALIIGGALALSYFIVTQFSKRRSKKNKKKKKLPDPSAEATLETDDSSNESRSESSLLGEIGTKVVNQATLILIDIARQKLMDYLQSTRKNDAS